jgi:hypothetical protein
MKARIDDAPTPYNLATALLGQVGPLLAPFQVVLRIMEVIFGINDALKSVTNPFKLAKALKKIALALQGLVGLLPGVAWVKLGRDIFSLFAQIFEGLAVVTNQWAVELTQMQNAFAARNALPSDDEILDLIACSKARLIVSTQGVNATLSDIGTLLALVGKLLQVMKPFMPGDIPKEILALILRIAQIPAEIIGINTAVDAADSSEDLDDVIDQLRELSFTMSNISDRFGTIAQVLTDVTGP